MSLDAVAIEGRGLTVTYRPTVDRKPTLRRTLGQMRHKERETIVALDAVDLEIMKGEAFGVIGRNGAGKSTLLKVLARTLKPDEGTLHVYGKTSTLLQLGVGFNAQLSGRRNVYLGGLAAGLRRAEVDAKFDDIVEYAGLWHAIDRPVKTYSSGMFARLAFAVGMAMEPNILLLDEVLAVGDEEFREKSMAAMADLLERAGTIVFVSHMLNSISQFCNRAIWLDEGRIRLIGEADHVADAYRSAIRGTVRTPGTPGR